MPFSAYLDKKLLDHVFGKATFSAPANIYVGLSSTTPKADGSNVTEHSGDGYARVSTSGSTWNSASGSGPVSNNSAASISFPVATADWGAFTYVVFYDASTSGNFLGYGQLSVPTTVLNTEVASFAINAISTVIG